MFQVLCPPTWDGWQCWAEGGEAGVAGELPCPQYIYFFTHAGHNGVGCQSEFQIVTLD